MCDTPMVKLVENLGDGYGLYSITFKTWFYPAKAETNDYIYD